MTVINTNVKALYTQAALSQSGRASEIAMRELSTGKRINSSKDDAAGLAIASRMTQNIQGLNQSIRNAGDAISMIQTAEGATQEITIMLQRMSELAVQSANSTYSTDQRSYLNEEFQQLKSEIVRVSEVHEWNGFPILNGKAGQNVGAPNFETTARLSVSANGQEVLKIATASPKVLADGDLSLLIEGTTPYAIPASTAASDTKTNTFASSSNAAGSAIAIAAAINSRTGETGVVAKANGAVISGAKTTVGTSSIQTDLFVNGVQVNLSLTSGQTESARRQYVMNSINAKTASHGVVAGDSGVGGLTLTTIDGRNLSVWYDASVAVGSDFGLGENKPTTSDPAGVTGVASAAAAAISNKTLTLSTTTSGSNTITVTSTTGLVAGMAVSGTGIPAGTTVTSVNSATGITLNNNATVSASSLATLTFTGGVKASTVYGTVDLDSEKQFTINPGVNGYPTNATSISGNQFLFSTPDSSTNPSTDIISVNFGGKTGTYTVGNASTDTATNFAAAINSLAGSTVAFVGASKTTASGVTSSASQKVLTLPDVTGLVVGMTVTGTGIAAGTKISSIGTGAVTLSADIGSGGVAAATVISFAGGNTSAVQIVAASDASTMTITAPKSGSKPAASTISGIPFIAATAQVTAKDPTYSNLSSLGFVPGAVNAKNVGRLNFQVGPAANQLISIDLADFGKNGDVTGPITSDKAPTNLLTVQSANDVIMNVNKSLDRIASTRANMGAVINRLTHVIDNLTNVVMNSESSRSQIEDADYAKASTELARTQIMQQAATAVLAQANTSQQTVLKLLQG
jgi:flagellin